MLPSLNLNLQTCLRHLEVLELEELKFQIFPKIHALKGCLSVVGL